MSDASSPPPKNLTPPPESGEGGGGGESLRPITTGTGGLRKKGGWVRAWLVVDSTGQTQVIEVGKHAIMKRTGLPARDLRILDPVLSYPSTILGRERAIVVNLELKKAIITANEVLFLNFRDPLVDSFVKKLQGIFRHRQTVEEAGGDGNNAVWANLHNSEDPQPMEVSPNQIYAGNPNKKAEANADEEQKVGQNAHGLKLLPFEFVALEACLEAACTSLEDEATRLEQEAYPALDRLTSKISTLNLERVRQIKSRLVTITIRVQKVRDELEHLLDDDEDMAEMYLTDKFEKQQLESSFTSSIEELDGMDDEVVPPDVENRTPDDIMMGFDSTRSATTKNLDVEELEMILEAYFVQIEGTLNKLSTLREYVDDTEDYLNLMLDDKQNHLLQMGVLLSTATCVLSAYIAMAGVFGMNFTDLELFKDKKSGMQKFLWTIAGGALGCLFFYVAAIAWYKHKRILT